MKSIFKHPRVDAYVGKDFYGDYVSQVFQQSPCGEPGICGWPGICGGHCICGRKVTITKIYKKGSMDGLDLCIDCTAKYNLNSHDIAKRKKGLALLVMKGIL